MTEYINDFDEVCLAGSNSTTDRRPASDLELSQRDEIAELEAKIERLESRGIEDMHHTIATLTAERDALVEAARNLERAWENATYHDVEDTSPARSELFELLIQFKEQGDER
jgi:deoxycytidylate deaminase